MPIIPKPMTKEELAKTDRLPPKYKKALEISIEGWSDEDDPEDAVWPDYFRGEVVTTEEPCGPAEDDEVDIENNTYDTECVWFEGGWKANNHRIINELKKIMESAPDLKSLEKALADFLSEADVSV